MSNVYQPKRKELARVKVVSSATYGNNRSKLKFVGSVSRKHTNFVTTQRNKLTGKCSYIDDTSSLTMEKSPFNDGKKSFMRKQGTVAPKGEYSGKRTGSLTQKDYDQAKTYGERAKQKYLHKKSNDVPNTQ